MRTTTERIDVPTPHGAADAVLSRPDDDGAHPAVLLYMDAFGLRPRIDAMVERIASHGYVAVAPNVFYRDGRAPLLADLEELVGASDRSRLFERLGPFMRNLTPERAVSDAAAYLDFLDGHEHVAAGPVGVTGYCMGGALALRTAAHLPHRVAAVASFHGGNLATDAEDSPHRLADRVKAEVYVGHADNDRSMPPEQRDRLESAMRGSGVHFRAELYDGAAHGFTMADTPAYDEAAAERHWDRLLSLLDRALRDRGVSS